MDMRLRVANEHCGIDLITDSNTVIMTWSTQEEAMESLAEMLRRAPYSMTSEVLRRLQSD